MVRLLLASLALTFGMGAAPSIADPIKIGETATFQVSGCPELADIMAIVDYAKAHNGDGTTAFVKAKADGKCGRVTAEAMVVRMITEFTDAIIGDTLVVEFDSGGTHWYGILHKEQLVLTGA